MWVYYEEIDGRYDPKWVIIVANTHEDVPYYSLNTPFEKIRTENMYMETMTLSIEDLVINPEKEKCFGVLVHKYKERMEKQGIDPDFFNDIEYFIIQCDDLQEVMNMDLRDIFS